MTRHYLERVHDLHAIATGLLDTELLKPGTGMSKAVTVLAVHVQKVETRRHTNSRTFPIPDYVASVLERPDVVRRPVTVPQRCLQCPTCLIFRQLVDDFNKILSVWSVESRSQISPPWSVDNWLTGRESGGQRAGQGQRDRAQFLGRDVRRNEGVRY